MLTESLTRVCSVRCIGGEDYSSVNAVRTSLDGLREWLGISSVLVSAPIVDDNNRVKERNIRLSVRQIASGQASPHSILFLIGPSQFLEIRPSFMIWLIWKALLMKLGVGKSISKIIGPCVISFVFRVGRSIFFQ